MQEFLLVVQLLLASALIVVVLLQRSESDGFGMGSGGSNFLSGRASANLMTRTTAILAGLFIVNSLVLSIVASRHHQSSIADDVPVEESTTVPATAAPVATSPAKPAQPEAPKVPVAAPVKHVAPAPAPAAKPVVGDTETKSVAPDAASDNKAE